MNAPRKITIEAVLNGYIVKVGCQTVVFNDRNVMVCDLESYLANPQAMEKHYRENALNRAMLDDHNPLPKSLAASIRQDHATQCEAAPDCRTQFEPAPTTGLGGELPPIEQAPTPPPFDPEVERLTQLSHSIGAEIATRRMQPRGPERAG